MLRGLAEYSMSGRRQAATVAILLGLFPLLNLLSSAVVSLVTLRKGGQEGFLVMLWALLPAGLRLINGDVSLIYIVVAAWLLALLLRRTESWQSVLLAILALSWLGQLSLELQTLHVSQVRDMIEQLRAQGLDTQLAAADPDMVVTTDQLLAIWAQLYGSYLALSFVVVLCIGRHWQALLYNPGGFRQEFHGLRLDPRLMGLLLALIVAGEMNVPPLNEWVLLFCIPPLINGLAMAHCVIYKRGIGWNWLVLVYLVALLMAPAIVALGVLDSFFNLRQRVRPLRIEKDDDDRNGGQQ